MTGHARASSRIAILGSENIGSMPSALSYISFLTECRLIGRLFLARFSTHMMPPHFTRITGRIAHSIGFTW